MFSNHVYKTIILPTLVIRIVNLEIFLFCQHNSTGGGNLELRQTIGILNQQEYEVTIATVLLRVYRVSQNSRIPNSERGSEEPSGARRILRKKNCSS
jgi:hypothetical protein